MPNETEKKSATSSESWLEFLTKRLIYIGKLARISLQERLKAKARKIAKKTIGLALAIIGFIYLSTGIAVLLNELFKLGNWPGFTIVGIALLLVSQELIRSR